MKYLYLPIYTIRTYFVLIFLIYLWKFQSKYILSIISIMLFILDIHNCLQSKGISPIDQHFDHFCFDFE